MDIINKIFDQMETPQKNNSLIDLQKKVKIRKIIMIFIMILIVSVFLLLFLRLNNNITTKINQKENEKIIDSLRQQNDILLYDIMVSQEKVKQSEEKIQLLEKNFQQSIGKLQQIQNQFLHEKNNPVPANERPDAIRYLAKQ
jgi:predicted RND superfamily exporter protein